MFNIIYKMTTTIIDWTEIVTNKLLAWWVTLIANLPNILLATVVAIGFIFLARFIRKFTSKTIPKLVGRRSINSLFSNVAYMIVVLLGLFITLNILNLNQAVSSLLAGAGIIGLALGFAFQDLTANFISGIYIVIKKPFVVGQTIETNGFIGNIEDIQLRSTTIRTFQGLHLLIPNKDIFQKPLVNYSRSQERRIEFEFAISPDHDLKVVSDLCRNAVNQLEYIVKTKPVEVYYIGFGDNLIKIAIWFWIFNQKPPGFMVARNEAIMNIMGSFSQHKIMLITSEALLKQNEADALIKDKATDNHQKINI